MFFLEDAVLLCCIIKCSILFNLLMFLKNVGIEVLYIWCKDLLVSSETQKTEETMFCILSNELYKFSPHIPSYKESGEERECISKLLF